MEVGANGQIIHAREDLAFNKEFATPQNRVTGVRRVQETTSKLSNLVSNNNITIKYVSGVKF